MNSTFKTVILWVTLIAVGLVLVEGLSYKEAAEIMGVPLGTLTSRLARGREALQGLLADTTGALQ